MGDILIRDVRDGLRGALKMRASLHNRSVSDEAKFLLETALETTEPENEKKFVSVWDAFKETRNELKSTEEEHEEFTKILEDARKAPDRPVPKFE